MPEAMLNRRQIIVGAVVAASVSALPRWETIPMSFPRGAAVPPWIEVSTKPAFFGVEVEIAVEVITDSERASYRRMGYAEVPDKRLNVRATEPLAVGDCMIRYRCGIGGSHRTLFAETQPFRGRVWWHRLSEPPETWMWTDDGPDRLLFARVAEPDFRILNPRLAERVLL